MAEKEFNSVTICKKKVDWANYAKMRLPNSKPWTERDWLVHEQIFSRLAQPKRYYEPPEEIYSPARKKVLLKKLMPRITQLAKPKQRGRGRYVPPFHF